MDKFVIKCNRNGTSTVIVSVTEEDNKGETKAKKKKVPVEANKSKIHNVQVRKFEPKWLEGRSWLKHDVERNVMMCK